MFNELPNPQNILDALDQSVNSNTALLKFELSSDKAFDLKAVLIKLLKTGYFHHALLRSDIERGWEHYIEKVYSRDDNEQDKAIILPKPGNIWNGNEDLIIEEITIEKARELIVDLLTGEQRYFSRGREGQQFDRLSALAIFNNFIKNLDFEQDGELIFYNIKPDFLNTMSDYFGSDYIIPGYFEEVGRDCAIAILKIGKDWFDKDLSILLTNGYG